MATAAARAPGEPAFSSPHRPIFLRQLPVLGSVAVASLLLLGTLGAVLLCMAGRCESEAILILYVILGPSTCLLSVLVTWLCVRRQRCSKTATQDCVGGSALAGTLNLPLVVLVTCLLAGTGVGVLALSVLMSAFVGFAAGAPLGLLFGAVYRPLVRHGCRHDRSFESRERTAAYAATWLSAVSLACGAVATFFALVSTSSPSGAFLMAGLCAVVAAPSLVVATAHRLQSSRRRQWLEQVRQGEVDGWVLCPADRVLSAAGPLGPVRRDAPPLRPLLADHLPQSGVLARIRTDPRGGAYRSGTILEPVATV